MTESPYDDGIDYTDYTEPHVVEIDASKFTPRQRTTPEEILRWMKAQLKFYGRPLPDGYVPPPGIDLDALLRQLPPRPGGGSWRP